MIVVSDTTPLISLLKIDRIDLLEKLFGQVLIPQAVFDELTTDSRFKFEADQIKRGQFIKVKAVAFQMDINIMGTIGILMAAYEENELTPDEVRGCIEGLQRAGRHISHRHYRMLLDKLGG